MCGIVGFLQHGTADAHVLRAQAEGMANAVRHRGPDDAGSWADAESGIALGHRRLSIVDLSQAGHQPMRSAQGRFVLSYNGEIYNHAEMRRSIEAAGDPPAWRGHSDTETLLAAFELWGIEATLQKTVGMFAIALWDARERALYLIRDRFGEKPLYYGWTSGAFVFGSELKALRAYPSFQNAVSHEALAQFMRFMYVPAPRSIYQDVYKLEPGCFLRIDARNAVSAPASPLRAGSVHEGLSIHRWWALDRVVEAGAASLFTNEQEAVDALESTLSEAVSLQSMADVPLGAFLSGGVDSSTIVALMQRQSAGKVNTFTVGFEETAFDESQHARAVARHLGTMHTELFVTSAEARDVIPSLSSMYDEPFADSSQIPTHLICRVARQHVTVAMSGDGGDELFGGYNRYLWGPRMWRWFSWLPYEARRFIGFAMHAVPGKSWDAVGAVMNRLLPRTHGVTNASNKASKLASRLQSLENMDDLYMSLVSEWQDPAIVVRGRGGALSEPSNLLQDPAPSAGVPDGPLLMMYRDATTYLPDDILCKLDRASMATSLETRVPFLDHRVAELAWRLPLHMKIREGRGKWALRQVLYRHVPRELIERPKAGFGVPLAEWLRGPLRDWCEHLLDAARLEREGYFHVLPIREKWAQHLKGQDHTPSIWSVVIFQAWLDQAKEH
jgi:asparagine synthase (glutamine-hydrolysing)